MKTHGINNGREGTAKSSYRTITVIDYYLPGRLAGGPVTTIANMAQQFGSQLDTLIVTRNNDMDGSLYADINGWTVRHVHGADVLYLPAQDFNAQAVARIIRHFRAQQVYLNSFFSPFTVAYLLSHAVSKALGGSKPRIILAPRGEFSEGALRIKARKKAIYLAVFKTLCLQRQVSIYQASSTLEQADITRALGPVSVQIAPDIAAPVKLGPAMTAQEPRFVFVSRISPKKNLLGALDLLAQIAKPCTFDIYGPKEDLVYWEACERKIAALPSHIRVLHRGILQHDEVGPTLSEYSAFLFPTHGENFGHVIFESLAAGCPVIVSDQTPWQDLQQAGVGWTIPLSDTGGFREAIEQVLGEPLNLRQQRAIRCMHYAKAVSEDESVLEATVSLFMKS